MVDENLVLGNNNNSNKMETYLLLCQIKGLNEAKINKFVSNQSDIIVDFDFYMPNDASNNLKICTWSRDQYLRIHLIDMQQLAPFQNRDSQIERASSKMTREDEYQVNNLHLVAGANSISNTLKQLQTNTTNSSRKSSISDHLGNSPSNLNYFASNRAGLNSERDPSINQGDETSSIYNNNIDGFRTTNASNSISLSHNLFKTAHNFLKKNPKCFGARFTNLPEQFIIFNNEGFNFNNKSK
jgi:hypothetical protein